MWQRIQTLYLAIATALIVTLFFSDKAVIFGTGGEIARAYTYVYYTPYLILLIVIALLDLLAVTTFKNRIFQMRTAVLAALVTLALQGWLAVDYFTAADNLVFKWTAIFPLAAAILDLMGARSIYSDQLMVESFRSLRKRKR